MRLRPRLTFFTISVVLLVVAFTSVSTIFSLRYFLRREMKTNQLTWFNNFREACEDALYLGDDLAIQAYSESLEKSIPELAYAVFQDNSREGVQLGGIESLHRFKKLVPQCPDVNPDAASFPIERDVMIGSQRWRFYCEPFVKTNIRGEKINGQLFLGFNTDVLELKLQSIVDRLTTTLMGSMLVVLVLGFILAFLLAGKLTRPIMHLTEGAKAIGEGQLDTQIPVESGDELGFLAQEFNLMAVKLKELDQLKDDFVSSVSHELRSPLAAISGYVELLRGKPIEEIAPEKREKALGIIQESTERLAHFINDILDLAKLKAGHVEIHARPLNLKAMIDGLAGLFQPLLEKKAIELNVDIPVTVPEIAADEEKIRQVATNLLSNALKFTPAGGKITIAARNQTEFIQVSVQDTGPGIPEDAKDAVFERFKQVNSTKNFAAGQKGTGLGLAIAKGNVEAHGGRIWIESAVGKGTTVHFTLPSRVQNFRAPGTAPASSPFLS